MLHKANIAGLAMDATSNTPIIILKIEADERIVPIWIGLLEATSIASALKNVHFDRPMTHDLFKNFAELMKVTISKIEVCDIRDNTYFARIHFMSTEGSFSMDARPSDAIALALRYQAPIFVEEKVVQQSKPADEGAEPADESAEGKKWTEYLEGLSPDDFGKYMT